jgi:hypothetical protein
MSHLFELLFELIEFLEPYLLFTTIFIIPLTITITTLPRRFFAYEFTQHLLPSLFAMYEKNRVILEKLNGFTQNAMIVILMVDLFGLGHFFFGSHGGHEAGAHHGASHNAEHEAAGGHNTDEHNPEH